MGCQWNGMLSFDSCEGGLRSPAREREVRGLESGSRGLGLSLTAPHAGESPSRRASVMELQMHCRQCAVRCMHVHWLACMAQGAHLSVCGL